MLKFSSSELYLAGIDNTKEGDRFISFSECVLGCCGVDDTRGGLFLSLFPTEICFLVLVVSVAPISGIFLLEWCARVRWIFCALPVSVSASFTNGWSWNFLWSRSL